MSRKEGGKRLTSIQDKVESSTLEDDEKKKNAVEDWL